jgi:hypothetical protein
MTDSMATARAEVQTFFRGLTLENPKWVSRAEAMVRAGDKGMIRLLSAYIPALPPSLRAAVLDAQAKSARTLKTQHKDVETG